MRWMPVEPAQPAKMNRTGRYYIQVPVQTKNVFCGSRDNNVNHGALTERLSTHDAALAREPTAARSREGLLRRRGPGRREAPTKKSEKKWAYHSLRASSLPNIIPGRKPAWARGPRHPSTHLRSLARDSTLSTMATYAPPLACAGPRALACGGRQRRPGAHSASPCARSPCHMSGGGGPRLWAPAAAARSAARGMGRGPWRKGSAWKKDSGGPAARPTRLCRPLHHRPSSAEHLRRTSSGMT